MNYPLCSCCMEAMTPARRRITNLFMKMDLSKFEHWESIMDLFLYEIPHAQLSFWRRIDPSTHFGEESTMRCFRCKLQGTCRAARKATKDHFRWSIHNLVGHPLSELAYLVGLRRLSDWLHDKSVPVHESGTGRG